MLTCSLSECLDPAVVRVTFTTGGVYHYCARHNIGLRGGDKRRGWNPEQVEEIRDLR